MAAIHNGERTTSGRRLRRRLAWLLCFLAVLSIGAPQPWAQSSAAGPIGRYIPITLPITGNVDTRIKQLVDRILAELPEGGPRPVLVFEFRAGDSDDGAASEFERSVSLARYLASERLSRVKTVAYLPGSVKGHAVLPVIACEQLIVAGDAELGAAGVGESGVIEPIMRRGYADLAERRRTIPPPVALGMLDANLAVYKVQTLDGARFVLGDELEELKQTAAVQSVETISPPGDPVLLTGRDLRLKFGFATHLADDRAELASALELPPRVLEEDPSFGGDWRALRVDLDGPINAKTVNWVQRSIRDRLNDGRVNLVCVRIDSPGGSSYDSVRLAHFLADIDAGLVRTVAFVPREALADAALVALACDHVVMSEEAKLGGPGAEQISADDLPDLQATIKELARTKQRPWSLMMAMVDPGLKVYSWSREGGGQVRYWSDSEQQAAEDASEWTRGVQIDLREGLSGSRAAEMNVAKYLAESFDELSQLYNLDSDLESVQPNWAHKVVEALASPELAGTLLFVALFTLVVELAAPGLSVSGFISGLCFLLFFWSQYLHGTAGWLEILLFAGGTVCIALEVFVLPGVGIFGIGGGIMVLSSIVLASQTFVIPRNSYQYEQLSSSLLTAAAAGAGVLISLIVLRKYLPDAPLVRRLMLQPPEPEELSLREQLADYRHLEQKRGVAATQLTPSGKARFGDDLVNVISDGEVISRGAAIYVTEVRGSHVIVKAIESPEADSA